VYDLGISTMWLPRSCRVTLSQII